MHKSKIKYHRSLKECDQESSNVIEEAQRFIPIYSIIGLNYPIKINILLRPDYSYHHHRAQSSLASNSVLDGNNPLKKSPAPGGATDLEKWEPPKGGTEQCIHDVEKEEGDHHGQKPHFEVSQIFVHAFSSIAKGHPSRVLFSSFRRRNNHKLAGSAICQTWLTLLLAFDERNCYNLLISTQILYGILALCSF
jgi:hypothetical protein